MVVYSCMLLRCTCSLVSVSQSLTRTELSSKYNNTKIIQLFTPCWRHAVTLYWLSNYLSFLKRPKLWKLKAMLETFDSVAGIELSYVWITKINLLIYDEKFCKQLKKIGLWFSSAALNILHSTDGILHHTDITPNQWLYPPKYSWFPNSTHVMPKQY